MHPSQHTKQFNVQEKSTFIPHSTNQHVGPLGLETNQNITNLII